MPSASRNMAACITAELGNYWDYVKVEHKTAKLERSANSERQSAWRGVDPDKRDIVLAPCDEAITRLNYRAREKEEFRHK